MFTPNKMGICFRDLTGRGKLFTYLLKLSLYRVPLL